MVDTADLSHRFEGESRRRALALVGERWTMLILREAFFGVRRFGALARNLGIPRPTLSLRLGDARRCWPARSRPLRSRSRPSRVSPDPCRPRPVPGGRGTHCAGATRTSPGPKVPRSCCATTRAARSPTHASLVALRRGDQCPQRDAGARPRSPRHRFLGHAQEEVGAACESRKA